MENEISIHKLCPQSGLKHPVGHFHGISKKYFGIWDYRRCSTGKTGKANLNNRLIKVHDPNTLLLMEKYAVTGNREKANLNNRLIIFHDLRGGSSEGGSWEFYDYMFKHFHILL